VARAAAALLAAKAIWVVAGLALPAAASRVVAVGAAVAAVTGPRLWHVAAFADQAVGAEWWALIVLAGIAAQTLGVVWLAATAQTRGERAARVALLVYAAVLPVGGLLYLFGLERADFDAVAAAMIGIAIADVAGTLLVWWYVARASLELSDDGTGVVTAADVALFLEAGATATAMIVGFLAFLGGWEATVCLLVVAFAANLVGAVAGTSALAGILMARRRSRRGSA
jgi:hypothetical protein